MLRGSRVAVGLAVGLAVGGRERSACAKPEYFSYIAKIHCVSRRTMFTRTTGSGEDQQFPPAKSATTVISRMLRALESWCIHTNHITSHYRSYVIAILGILRNSRFSYFYTALYVLATTVSVHARYIIIFSLDSIVYCILLHRISEDIAHT